MSAEQFRYVEQVLNANNRSCGDGEILFHIFNWGLTWKHYDNPVHRHSFYEICYVLEGEGEYEDEEVTYRLEDGVLFASLPGHWHQIRSRTGLRLLFVAFEVAGGSALPAAQRYEDELLAAPSPVANEPEGVSALLWRALFRHVLQSQGTGEERTNALCAMLLRSFPETFGLRDEAAAARPKAASSRSRSHLIQLAKRFIRDNLSQPLRLEDVAACLNVSVRHLSRMFKEEAGHSFVDFVTRERMREAEKLLKTTIHSVKEIADLTGFQSVHYFTRVFSDRYGLPPAAFRRATFPGDGGNSAREQGLSENRPEPKTK